MAAPMLRFTPYAFSKMIFMRDKEGSYEVGGFGVSDPRDFLLIRDIVLPYQSVGMAAVDFSKERLPAFYEDMVDAGFSLPQFSRVWIHTHPFDGATPSGTDNATFLEVFGNNDWGVMFILAKTGKTTCRLCVNAGISLEQDINWRLEWGVDFPGSDRDAWDKEYLERVTKTTYTTTIWQGGNYSGYGSYTGPNRQYNGYRRGLDDDDDSVVLKPGENLRGGLVNTAGEPFQKERELLESSAKKNTRSDDSVSSGRSSGGNAVRESINDVDDLEEWQDYHRLAAEEDELEEIDAPFTVVDDIPWIL